MHSILDIIQILQSAAQTVDLRPDLRLDTCILKCDLQRILIRIGELIKIDFDRRQAGGSLCDVRIAVTNKSFDLGAQAIRYRNDEPGHVRYHEKNQKKDQVAPSCPLRERDRSQWSKKDKFVGLDFRTVASMVSMVTGFRRSQRALYATQNADEISGLQFFSSRAFHALRSAARLRLADPLDSRRNI